MNGKKRLKVKKNGVLGINFDGINCKMWQVSIYGREKVRVLKTIKDHLYGVGLKKPFWIATVNPEFMMKVREDRQFLKILQKTDLNVADGIGLIWAREVDLRSQISDLRFGKRLVIGFQVGMEILQGKYKDQVVAGSDLVEDLCKMAANKGYRVFFLGGWGERAKKSADFFKSKFQISNDQIQYCAGEPGVKNEDVLKKINEYKPHILFVAYGMKKQEEWIDRNLSKLKVGVVIGVGRSFDYYSGDLKRAPMIWRKMGMEWLYSLIQEPKRWKRQLALPKFIWKVIFG